MTSDEARPLTVAEGFLSALTAHGVDYLFGNGGTDFPSIIEGLARMEQSGQVIPTAVSVPHENLAMAMAYGHTMVSGRAQAVVVHVNVGTANAMTGLFNAARGNIPMLLAAGRTPLTEQGPKGARTRFIQWAQEMYDQGSMVREAVKWDMELNSPGQIGTVVDRAMSVARAAPAGPVYLSLPREVLAEDLPETGGLATPNAHKAPAPSAPSQLAIDEAVDILAEAKNPMIITSTVGRDVEAFNCLSAFADRFAIPVVSHFPCYVCLPSSHPMHAGYEPAPLLADADAILVIDCDVPWIPNLVSPSPECRVIQAGPDPIFTDYPLRNFPCHLALEGNSYEILNALNATLMDKWTVDDLQVVARRQRLKDEGKVGLGQASGTTGIGQSWISRCIDDAKSEDTIVISEMGLDLTSISFEQPATFFGPSPSGGLGWGLGAALGAKLAAPERTVIAVVGDGSYMFGNPTPAHLVADNLGLAILVIVINNGKWGAVERATRAMYPDGAAVASNNMPLTTFGKSPSYEMVAMASGAIGERVEDPNDLPTALERALAAVKDGKQVLLNVIC